MSQFLAPVLADAEEEVERTLRPRSLADFVGQERVKEQLEIALAAAKARGEALDHLLLAGPPGLGKTSLAQIVRNELGVGIRQIAGPGLERKDIAAILTSLEPRDVLFIDEIHRISRAAEEILYPALEDFRLDIVMGQGPAARTLTLDLPPFTLVGATTRTGLLTTPLRDRFGLTFRLDLYAADELAQIVRRSARILDVELAEDAGELIAGRSRGTPRIANRILRRVRDVARGAPRGSRHDRDRRGGAHAARGRRRRPRALRPRAAALRRRTVRRRPGRPVDARRRARRGVGDDRGRLRAVPAPARLPAAHPARQDRHRPSAERTSASSSTTARSSRTRERVARQAVFE